MQLARQHQQLLDKDEQFHLQRAKKDWAMHGDRNTRFFHQAIIKRTREDRITFLQNPDGTESTTHEQLANTLSNYFHDIFAVNASTNQVHADLSITTELSQIQQPHIQNNLHNPEAANRSQLSLNQMMYTDAIPTMQELHSIIKSMRSNVSPGPEGLNAAFYKSAWP